MINIYPNFKRGEIDEFYSKLPKEEKELIAEYLDYRKARGVNTAETLGDIRRYILHVRFILGKDIREITQTELVKILAIVSGSHLSSYAKNKIKIDTKNFLKHIFKDWSIRFNNLEDIRLGSNERNEKKINSKTIITHEKIEKLVKGENNNYWRAFLLVQYEGGLRTIETRLIKWEDIKLNVDGDLSEISIYATKTHKARTIFVNEATFYLNKLKEEQENAKDKGVYVFHRKKNKHDKNDSYKNDPVGKWVVNKWFSRLTEKVLGYRAWNYLSRHGRATELYRMAKENKISKETAIAFMGHSDDMSNTYTHLDTTEIKKMLRDQVYKIDEVPEDKIPEIEKLIDKKLAEYMKGFQAKITENIMKKMNKK